MFYSRNLDHNFDQSPLHCGKGKRYLDSQVRDRLRIFKDISTTKSRFLTSDVWILEESKLDYPTFTAKKKITPKGGLSQTYGVVGLLCALEG